MKAVLMTQVGSPEVLQPGKIDEPVISRPGEMKIRLKAAGINPIDTKVRSHGLFYENSLPAVLGCDGAGIVTDIGAEVDDFKPGDEVWFCHGGLGREQGNYAEYTVIDKRWVALKPCTLNFVEAAALPLVLITAWGALFDRGGLESGQTVLIHAGAGGVGHVAIQLAKLKGARVLTTVSSNVKRDFVKSLGADEVINYREQNVLKRVLELTANKGADLVLDTVGAEVFKNSIEATAHFGTLVTLLDPGPLDLSEARMRNLKIAFELMLTPMLRGLDTARDQHIALLKQCAIWLDNGRLKCAVSAILPLEQAAEAHRLIGEGHTSGKIVLEV
ncbi:MAG: alcohol dehydrogenase [Gammaproteobacteria bacterium HGW-Gammaproteobacteria-3]|nr:MAG: alcohol dehydrogenase [Gammaproteobacteria bacterium HGW-Gammaproteobacteria-3]